MSTLYGILAVALLALLIFLTMVKQRANTDLYHKLHPPKKQQEEFLRACELYLEYRKNPEEHPKPAKDAKRDAAMEIETEGYLPASLEHLGKFTDKRERSILYAANHEPAHFTYQAIETASEETFHTCQTLDKSLAGYSQDKRFWSNGTFSLDAWNRYCEEMDEAFRQIAERYSNEI